MKSGFKPKEFTKKEWQANRIRKCKGSGVGKALDTFQKKCSFTLEGLERKDILESMKAVNALKAALDVAKGKCDKLDDSVMIKGIDAYHSILNDYKKALAMTNVALENRRKYHVGLKVDTILKDASALRVFVAHSKKALFADELDAFLLHKKKKLPEAVKKYGKKNDYNIPDALNKALIKIYLEGVPQADLANDRKLKKYAKGDIANAFDMQMIKMMNGSVSSFKDTDDYKQFIRIKFPILNFSF